MNCDATSKFRIFGKAGRIITTVLTVTALLITLCCGIATAFAASLPEDALTVSVTENTTISFNKKSFNSLWAIIGGRFGYSGESDPDYVFGENGSEVTPPENEKFEAELKLFNRYYASAELHSEGNAKVMEAESSPAEYDAKNLVKVFAFATLLAAAATVSLWMLRRLFAVLTKCDSPFCDEAVTKMRSFAFSLLPVAVFASVSETMLQSFFSAGRSSDISIQWGVLIAFVVTLALVSVFRYGVLLQKESDETL